MGDRSEGRRKRLGVSYLPFTIDDLGGAGYNGVGREVRGWDRTKEGGSMGVVDLLTMILQA